MPRIAIMLPALLLGSVAVAHAQQPAIDPKVMEWVEEIAPKIMEMLPLDPSGRPAPSRAGEPVLPGRSTETMPIWECRDIVRNNPDWPRNPEMVAFMRKCGVFPPRQRAY